MVRRTDIQHNTPEQARDYLLGALALVEELDPPDDLREAVFVKAADLIASKQIMFEQPQQVPFDPRLLRSQ